MKAGGTLYLWEAAWMTSFSVNWGAGIRQPCGEGVRGSIDQAIDDVSRENAGA